MELLSEDAMLDRLAEETAFAAFFSFPVRPLLTLWQAMPKEEILHQGQQPDRLYYLVRGQVKLSQTLANGKVVTLDLARAPCFVGELELLQEKRAAISVRAMERSLLFGLELSECRRQLLSDAVFLRRLCEILAAKERLRARALTQAQAYPLANRLALFILHTASKNCYRVRNIDACQYLGVSYRHLQQTLSDFTARGLLKKQEKGYLLTDRAALCALAEEPAGDWEPALL